MNSLVCLAFFFLLSPNFWHGLLSNTPAKVIAAAAVVSMLVQLVKQFAPNVISGKVAMAVNLATSLSAVFLTLDPTHFWSLQTLQSVAVVFTAAAGIHSTAKSLFKAPPEEEPAAPAEPGYFIDPNGKKSLAPGANSRAIGLVVTLLMGSILISGCGRTATASAPQAAPAIGAVDQVDQKANQDLQAIHAFLATVADNIRVGQLVLSSDQVKIVDNADRAANVAQAAERAYHAGGGGDASVLNAAMAAAQSAFSAVQSTLSQNLTK